MLWPSLSALIATFIWVNRYEAKIKLKQSREDAKCFDALNAQIMNGKAMVVKGGVGFPEFFGVWMLAAAVAIKAWEEGGLFVLGALFLWFVALTISMRVASRMSRPALIITRRGIQPAAGHFLEWHEIYGMRLQEYKSRGMVLWHFIEIYSPCLRQKISHMNWPARIYYWLFARWRLAKTDRVALRATSETPQLVYALVQHFWQESTGRITNPFIFDNSAYEVREAERQIEDAEKRIRVAQEKGQILDRETLQLDISAQRMIQLKRALEEEERGGAAIKILAVTLVSLVLMLIGLLVGGLLVFH
jgi:hypothetical protein